MTIRRYAACAMFFLAAVVAVAFQSGVAGKWTAAIDTPVGMQNYTYVFQVDGEKLTGTAKSQFSESAITEGTVKNQVSSILAKVRVRDRTLAVLKALEEGWF